MKVVKNKVAPPFKQVEFDIMYGEGVSKVGEILDLGVKAGLVEKSGAWFSYDWVRIGQGRENAKIYLKENPDVAKRIENAIRGQDRGGRRGADGRPRRGRGRRRLMRHRVGCSETAGASGYGRALRAGRRIVVRTAASAR